MSAPHSNNWAKTGIERRRHPRKPPSAIPQLKAVRIVAGPEAKLINISRSGALIETEARLAPSSQIGLRLVTAETVIMLKGRVVYSRLAALGSSAIRFQSAIQFDEEFLLLDAEPSADAEPAGSAAEAPNPDRPAEPAPPPEDGDSLVMFTANASASSAELRNLFGLNNW